MTTLPNPVEIYWQISLACVSLLLVVFPLIWFIYRGTIHNKVKKKDRLGDKGPVFRIHGFEKWALRQGIVLPFGTIVIAYATFLFIWGIQRETVESAVVRRNTLLAYLVPLGRGCGKVTNLSFALTLLCMCRMPLTWLSQTALSVLLPLKNSFPFHRYLAWATVVLGTLHGIAQTANVALNNSWDADGVLQRDKGENISNSGAPFGIGGGYATVATGWALVLIFFIMAIPYYKPFRAFFGGYETFLKVHWLWMPFCVCLAFHGTERGQLQTVYWITPPLLLLVLHYCMLYLSGKRMVKSVVVLGDCVTHDSARVIRLTVLRGDFSFQSGQYAQLEIPQVGKGFHPFSIASAPCEEMMLFYIRVTGDWTERLWNLVRETEDHPDATPIQVTLAGPFGAPSEFVHQFEHVLVIGSGVGITPFLSVLREIAWYNKVRELISEEAFALSEDPDRVRELVGRSRKQFEDHLAESAEGAMINHKRNHVKRHQHRKPDSEQVENVNSTTDSSDAAVMNTDNKIEKEENTELSLYQRFDDAMDVITETATYAIAWLALLAAFSLVGLALAIPHSDFFIETVQTLAVIYSVLGWCIVFGCIVDIIYRVGEWRSKEVKLKNRQVIEHILQWIVLFGTITVLVVEYLLVGVVRPREDALSDYEISLVRLMHQWYLLCGAIGQVVWLLLYSRVTGSTTLHIRDNIMVAKPTRVLHFIAVDKSAATSFWLLREIAHLNNLLRDHGTDAEFRFSYQVYLTREDENPTAENSTQEDPLARLQAGTVKAGRPNWYRALGEFVQTLREDWDHAVVPEGRRASVDLDGIPTVQNKTVGIFFCGNPVIGLQIREAAAAHHNEQSRLNFVWHQEAFG